MHGRCVKRLDSIEKLTNIKAQGRFPISLYRWDLDCILDVLDDALNDKEEYPDKDDEGYIKLNELYTDLKKAYQETYET